MEREDKKPKGVMLQIMLQVVLREGNPLCKSGINLPPLHGTCGGLEIVDGTPYSDQDY